MSGGSIRVTSGNGENLERLRPIPVTGIREPFQRLEPFACVCLFKAELASIATGLECFKLRLPSIEVVPDSGDLLREHVVTGELSAQSPIPLSVAMLDEETVMRRRGV